MDKISELLARGVENIIPGKAKLEKLLKSGKKLNVYLGIDPTSTNIHLGHAVPLRKLQALVGLGHNVTFVIGDFTALIGDTSDKDTERPVLTYEQIQQNFKTYKKQAEKILDFSRVAVRHNSEWLSKLDFVKVVELCQHFSVGDFVSRELIRKRMDAGKRVALHEVLYPVMQGYDSYFLDTDIQIGGTDQTFNMQAGRVLQKDLRDKESFVISNGFLTGTDGRKMSKSWGNAIWLTDNPDEMYGKVMSIRDDLITEYFTLATDMPLNEIANLPDNPLENKKLLATKIVTQMHSGRAAEEAAKRWTQTFSQKQLPADMPTHFLPRSAGELATIDLLTSTKLVSSKAEAKRLLKEGAIEWDSKKISPDDKIELVDEHTLKVGKRRFAKIKVK